MTYAVQCTLFGHVDRRLLGNGAWIDVCSDWLNTTDAPDSLFDELATTTPWRAERRPMYDRIVDVPRLLSFHDLITEAAPHPRIAELRDRLNDIYADELGEPFTTAGLCLYRDGNDSVAWHGDRIGRGRSEDTMVAIVSLGATRVLALRPKGGGPAATTPASPWRPSGDGRLVSADVGALGAQDQQAQRPADQHPVPAAQRALAS